MTTIRIPLDPPPVLEPRAVVRNRQYPTASNTTALIRSVNHAANVRVKEVFHWGQSYGSTPSSAGAGQRARWAAAYHSSPFVTRLVCVATLARATSATLNPYVQVAITTLVSPALVGSVKIYGGANASGAATDIPSQARGVISGLPADTDLTIDVSDFDNGRVTSIVVYEEALVADTSSGYPDPSISVFGPILDATRQAVAVTASSVYRRGAAQLWNWTADLQSAPATTVSATSRNLIDNASTSNTVASAGAYLNMTGCGHGPSAGTGVASVAFRMVALAQGANGSLLVTRKSDGLPVASLLAGSFGASPSWVSTTGIMRGDVDKYDLFFSRSTSGTFNVFAVSLFLYET